MARKKAGKSGAETIDVNHLLYALIVEDQGGELTSRLLNISLDDYARSVRSLTPEPHHMFFLSDVAAGLVASLDSEAPSPKKAIPDSTDMPLSPRVEKIFQHALEIRQRLNHSKVEPLHLLAAALADQSSRESHIFRQSGVIYEDVLRAMS